MPGFFKVAASRRFQKTLLVVEAGEMGWHSIELKELFQSGMEFFGEDGVAKLVVDKRNPYVKQIHALVESQPVTHYLYDPRTGHQEFLPAFRESISLAVLFARYRIVPVVLLTDLSYRLWRCKAAAVTATNGVVVTLMMPKLVQPIFPHRRLTGPSLMPFSHQLLDYLDRQRADIDKKRQVKSIVRFTGSMYEPRTSFLNQLASQLEQSGHSMEIMGRELGSKRVSDDEYWNRIGSAEIVVTTATQAAQPGNDWEWIPHLVYRYLEVLAAGSLLLAPPVPGIGRFFTPGVHFAAFNSVADAVEQAAHFLENPEEARKIKQAGYERAAHLIRSNAFWLQIDAALGSSAFVLSNQMSNEFSGSSEEPPILG